MSLFQKRSGGQSPFPIPPVSPFPGMSIFGGTSTDQAMRITGVWACVRLLAETVSQMPLHAFTMRDGVRVPIPDPVLVQQPSPSDTMQDWVYQIMVSLLLRGNAYGQITARDHLGYPRAISILSPDVCDVYQNPLDASDWRYRINGQDVDAFDVFHVAAFRMPGSRKGLSPIAYAARTLATTTAAEAFGQSFFEDGAHPSSILTTEQPVSETTAAAVKERLMSAIHGREPVVLGAGVKWQPVQVTPEESQFLATQEFGLAQIARIFGVPGELIGVGTQGGSITYANVTERALDFLTYAVQPWLTRIESAMFPLLPNQRHVRFDTSTLIRLDPETTWKINAEKLNTAAARINEVRADSDMPPVEWGDEPYLPAIKTTAAGIALQVGDKPGSGKVADAAPDPEASSENNGTSEDSAGGS